MPKATTYANDTTLTGTDKLFGTDSAGGNKNYTLSDLTTYFSGQITILQDEMPVSVYDPAGIEEQLVGLTATQTLTNKTINGSNNTITNVNSSNVVLDSFVGQIINQTDIDAYIKELESVYLNDFMYASDYDPAGIEEQLVGLTATQTLTNKTLDFTSSSGTNTISLDSSDVSVSPFIGQIGAETDVQSYIEANDGRVAGKMNTSTYDAASVNEQLVGLTATQTLTNKTLDFTSASGSGSFAADSSDIEYDNSSSSIESTNAKTAIDELSDRQLVYSTNNATSSSFTISASSEGKINERSASSAMTTIIADVAVTDMKMNSRFAFHNTSGQSQEFIFSNVTLHGQPSGTITSDNEGDIVWFQKIGETSVIMWGDYVNTP